MQRQKQLAVIRADTALSLLQNYQKPYLRETGKHIQYDIEQLKNEPGKLGKWFKQRIRDHEPETLLKETMKIKQMEKSQRK